MFRFTKPLLYQPAALGVVVATPLIVGAVLSILIPETVVLFLLLIRPPPRSPLFPSAPPVRCVASAAQLWIPESVSAQLKRTVTSFLYQPAALGELVAAPLIVGAVLSMLIPETVVLALLPALSSAVPLADWAAPSALRVIGLVQLAIPERRSEQRKLAVTSLLFQPLALAAELSVPLA